MILNDHEPPKRGFGDFLQYLATTHISTVNCDETAGDRSRKPTYKISSIERF